MGSARACARVSAIVGRRARMEKLLAKGDFAGALGFNPRHSCGHNGNGDNGNGDNVKSHRGAIVNGVVILSCNRLDSDHESEKGRVWRF